MRFVVMGTKNIFHIIGWHKGLFPFPSSFLVIVFIRSFSYDMAWPTHYHIVLCLSLSSYKITFPLLAYALSAWRTQVECLKSIPAWDKVLFDRMIRKNCQTTSRFIQKWFKCKSSFTLQMIIFKSWFKLDNNVKT